MKWKWEKNNNLTVLLLFLIQFVFAIAAIVCGMWLELYMRQLFLIKIQHISGAVESYGRKIEFIQKDGFFQFSQKSSFVFSQSPPPSISQIYLQNRHWACSQTATEDNRLVVDNLMRTVCFYWFYITPRMYSAESSTLQPSIFAQIPHHHT